MKAWPKNLADQVQCLLGDPLAQQDYRQLHWLPSLEVYVLASPRPKREKPHNGANKKHILSNNSTKLSQDEMGTLLQSLEKLRSPGEKRR